MKESALGLVPDLTGTKPLVESVGYARALEICVTARMVGAREAVDIGLATAAVPAAELDATVADLVAALTAPMPGAARGTKALLQGAAAHDLDTQRRVEREAQVGRFRELAALMGQVGLETGEPERQEETACRWHGHGTRVAPHADRPRRRRQPARPRHRPPRARLRPAPPGR